MKYKVADPGPTLGVRLVNWCDRNFWHFMTFCTFVILGTSYIGSVARRQYEKGYSDGQMGLYSGVIHVQTSTYTMEMWSMADTSEAKAYYEFRHLLSYVNLTAPDSSTVTYSWPLARDIHLLK